MKQLWKKRSEHIILSEQKKTSSPIEKGQKDKRAIAMK